MRGNHWSNVCKISLQRNSTAASDGESMESCSEPAEKKRKLVQIAPEATPVITTQTKQKLSSFASTLSADEIAGLDRNRCFLADANDLRGTTSTGTMKCPNESAYAEFQCQNTTETNEESQSKKYISAFANEKRTKLKEETADSSSIADKKKYTPLEKQVMEIKGQNPDVLLLVECGYRFRFFGNDAEVRVLF